jgi:phosphate starvation-inducible protein PhoH and related proteins
MPKRKKINKEECNEIAEAIKPLGKIKIKLKQFDFSEKQKELLSIIFDKKTKVVFLSGPAGTSKTFMAIYSALQLFNMDNKYSLSYIRTIIESADRGMGALPGNIDEKFCPFMMPLQDKLNELTSNEDTQFLIDQKILSAIPINYLRGASLRDQIVIADESQNFSVKELITLITRIGENTKMIICGDTMQSDISGRSGFKYIKDIFNDEDSAKQGIHNFEFNYKDIKRSEILKYIIKKLENSN